MTFERSQFGEGGASGAGNVTEAVSNHYGPRTSKHVQGIVKTEGYTSTLSLSFDHVQATADAFQLGPAFLPAGARITKVIMITRVLGVTGAVALVDIGTDGSEITNGFTITEAQLETAAGTVLDLTSALSGTWDAEKELAADTDVGINLSVEAMTAGEFDIEITYDMQRAV